MQVRISGIREAKIVEKRVQGVYLGPEFTRGKRHNILHFCARVLATLAELPERFKLLVCWTYVGVASGGVVV